MLRHFEDRAGVGFIWSMWEGYLTEDSHTQKCADELGIEIKRIHTSGHAIVDDLKSFAEALSPKVVIPMHTEYPDQYDKIFANIKQLKDGEVFEMG